MIPASERGLEYDASVKRRLSLILASLIFLALIGSCAGGILLLFGLSLTIFLWIVVGSASLGAIIGAIVREPPSLGYDPIEAFKQESGAVLGPLFINNGFEDRGFEEQHRFGDGYVTHGFGRNRQAIEVTVNTHYRDGPPYLNAALFQLSSHATTAVWLSVGLGQCIELQSPAAELVARWELQRFDSLPEALKLMRSDFERYCIGFLRGDERPFREWFSRLHPDWVWRQDDQSGV